MKLHPLARAGAGLAALAALSWFLPTDFENIPEPIGAAAAKVRGSQVPLAAAVAAAEAELGGLAREARLDLATGTAHVWVYTQAESWRVQVGAGGKVVEKKQDSEYVLPGAPVQGEPKRTSSGLMYYDIEEGGGETPPNSSAQVTVHYTGWLLDGKKFDSSVDRKRPATFALNQVIAGWTEGVGSMRVGGKRKLVIPHALAYGAAGSPPTIPPKATLVFDVELIAIGGR